MRRALRVLIVGEPSFRARVRVLLVSQGWTDVNSILMARTGEEAIDLILAEDFALDLVIIDLFSFPISMPIHGMEVNAFVKMHDQHIRVIVASEYSILKSEAKEADGFLEKPIGEEQFQKLLQELFKKTFF